MILYITSHKDGRLLGSCDAAMDIKQDGRFVVPPYYTPAQPPGDFLGDDECWAYLDDGGQPVREYNNGSWVKKKKQVEVTAYHKQTHQAKEFDDRSLVADEYTLNEPPTPYHDFVDNDWLANKEKAANAKRAEINNWRKQMENNESQIVSAIGFDWDAGPSARLRIDSALLNGVAPQYWTDANNVDHEGMTLEELKQVRVAISELGFATHDRQRTMKKEVETLTNFDEILNYPVGWPEE
ncbi:tail fiber assembly protein [Vibrio phage H188]|nr:tail fiber assembly protein [Vibrio phage H188]